MKALSAELLDRYCSDLVAQYGSVKKILLMQAPQFVLSNVNRSIALKKGYYAHPPLGLLFLCEALKDRGLEIRLLDFNLLLLKEIVRDESFDPENWIPLLQSTIDEFRPDMVGVSCMFDGAIQFLLKALDFLMEQDRLIVICGGVIPSFEWKSILDEGRSHFVIRGEGEDKLKYLCDHLTGDDRATPSSGGICFKYDAEVVGGDDEPGNARLDFPIIDSYSLIDLEEYARYGSLNPFERMAGGGETAFATIQMSRGCRGHCTFCAIHGIMGKGVRVRSVEDVFAEMEFLVETKGVRHFDWSDDDLLFHRAPFQELLRRIIERKWPITWSTNNGLIAMSVDEKTLGLMNESGCIGFRIGIETGNPEMLRKINKPATLEGVRKMAGLVHAYPRIFVGGNIILGLPGETFHQMMDSFNFSLELGLDWMPVAVCQPVRGASAFSDFQDYFDDQMHLGCDKVVSLMPVRAQSDGHLTHESQVLKGYDVFSLSPETVPDSDQVNEIWFTFNLLINYVFNKNLDSATTANKFVNWVEMAQRAHPPNGYMSLFLALGYEMVGNAERADYYIKCYRTLALDSYWRERFDAFALTNLLTAFPRGEMEILACIKEMRQDASRKSLCSNIAR
jgi:radical SAM superfamily enzyme YgiQ (UPF0313 family)